MSPLSAETIRERDSARKRQLRAAERDLQIPRVASWPRRKKHEADVYSWLNFYCESTFWGPWTDNRKAMVAAILDAAKYGGDQCIAAPRADGKTTIAECVTLYCVLTGVLRFPLIVAATGPDATRILGNMKRQFERNQRLLDDYPKVCFPIHELKGAAQAARTQTVNGELTYLRWAQDHIILPTVKGSSCSGAVIMTRGLDAAIRGIRIGDARPDLVIIDDPETRESVKSEKQTETREQTIEQDIAGLGGPGQRMSRVMLTTIMRRVCLSETYSDPAQKPSWKGKRFRLLENPPDDTETWEEYQILRRKNQQEGDPTAREAHQWYLDRREQMDKGAKCSNPDRYIADLMPDGSQQEVSGIQHAYNIISDRGEEAFATEYQNDPPEEDIEDRSGITAYLVQHQLSNYPRGVVPPEVKAVVAAVDIGKYACHWAIVAWRADATGYVVDYGVQDVWSSVTADERAIDTAIHRCLHDWRSSVLASPCVTVDKESRRVDLVLIDCGYRGDVIYQFCNEMGGDYRPAMGMGESAGAPTKAKYRPTGRSSGTKRLGDHWCLTKHPEKRQWFVLMDADHWKRWVHDRFLTPIDRPGSLLLFGSEARPHIGYAKHLTAEEEVGGKWVQTHRQNHWFDATYMAAVAGNMRGIQLLAKTQPVAQRGAIKLSDLQRQKAK